MVILKNIKLKNQSDEYSKLNAVKMYQKITGNSLFNSKRFIEVAILDEIVEIEDNELGLKIGELVFECKIEII